MIGFAGDHRSDIRSACTSRSMVSRKSLSPRISSNSFTIAQPCLFRGTSEAHSRSRALQRPIKAFGSPRLPFRAVINRWPGRLRSTGRHRQFSYRLPGLVDMLWTLRTIRRLFANRKSADASLLIDRISFSAHRVRIGPFHRNL